ncbi:CmpA/NrtA family ABC transporter substrate-binding protein [Caulobacter segnis]|uniref:NMT1/THI5 like domain protein n=1 Tax=Caulobacter segnis (strain ATCC 21756 / DSM 7131 / JCM 7823 / NBRC 15250 / LMG 17158 / TK0059) TaxID=509190 RepID=D5VGT3_CAUST|nr:CmpA/NrtA family ABC transporter substrate-binding protein [Caulobacter segnis]ADG10526.1 NMT1/THI5 like domain protein [Caulobacter segnis ATCC 21756]
MSGLSELRLGFIPLTDCAPLIAAQAQGFFEEEGLAVELVREASWATIRDKVAVGALDGAHMLAPMALATAAEDSGSAVLAPLALNRNGSAITVSTVLFEALDGVAADLAGPPPSAARLQTLIAERRARGDAPLTFAVVFPYSMHNYLLRYWLAQGGIDPDRDVRLVVIPPPRMVERMRAGEIDGFCVGAPWNAVAELEGIGRILAASSQLWPGGPDKVLGVSSSLAVQKPDELRALLRAIIRGAAWADAPENREALIAHLAGPERIEATPTAISRALEHEVVFHRGAAGLPRREHGLWFLSQMIRWGQIDANRDLEGIVDRVYRPDLYRDAALSLGPVLEPALVFPDAVEPIEARLFDGITFEPAAARAYAESFAIARVQS